MHVARTLATQTDGEVRIASILKEKFPQATSMRVVDISGKLNVIQSLYVIHCDPVLYGDTTPVTLSDGSNAFCRWLRSYV